MSAASDSERQLVQACLQGNPQSFAILYDRFQQPVRSTLFQLCGATQLDDLVQEVFLRAWKGLPKFRHNAKFSTWLYRIAWNVASDRRKQLARTRSREQSALRDVATFGQAATRERGIDRLHYRDVVQKGLAQLSLEHRSVLVLHDLEDVPQKEVADILGIPVGTVKSRLHHARTAMKRYLEQQGVEL
ncbi:sigma-70 family RNA polymerase sigma factor [Synechococcus sp. PCC 7336]|uniref:sigma-70 family RNA polymerase sigma factor n=1 Tax=Synechococcus sp. PCC 7336 TaxID=195250 RepID=UPI00034B38A1|nr:sigma-70 family RNA polymerase sigma factor [Synechococcus sp. PCC 7336]